MTPLLLKKQILELLWVLLVLTQLKMQLIWYCWMITLLLLSQEWRKVKIMLLSTFLAESCWQPHSTGRSSQFFPPALTSPLPFSFWIWKCDFASWKNWELIPFIDTWQTDNKEIILLSHIASVCYGCLFKLQRKALPILFLCSSEPHKDTNCFLYIYLYYLLTSLSLTVTHIPLIFHHKELVVSIKTTVYCGTGLFPQSFSLKDIFYFHLNFEKALRE